MALKVGETGASYLTPLHAPGNACNYLYILFLYGIIFCFRRMSIAEIQEFIDPAQERAKKRGMK